MRSVSGVGERPQQVEQGAHAEFAAHRGCVFHRAMVIGREHETQADLAYRPCDFFRPQVDVDTQCFQHIGAAGLGRHRTAAMLGDMGPGRGGGEGGCGRDVEGMGAIAPGAAGIDQMLDIGQRHLDGELAHDAGSCGDFANRLALAAQGADGAGNLRGREPPGHDGAHQAEHFLATQVTAMYQLVEQIGVVHRPASIRKFLSSACPCSVRMDSGWNCTPSTAKALWRTPMISPSSVHAVISRHSGRLTRSITREW